MVVKTTITYENLFPILFPIVFGNVSSPTSLCGVLVFAHAASNDPRRFASRLQMFSRQVEFLGVNATKRPCACCDFFWGVGGWGGLITFIAVRSLTLLHIRHAT